MIDNTVIKNLNKEHGKAILRFFEDKGIDTKRWDGIDTEEEGDTYIYYGVINGSFNNFTKEELPDYVKIITLPTIPEAKTFPIEMIDNTVVKNLNKKHGKVIIKFFEDKGIDAEWWRGMNSEEDGDKYIYYGVVDGEFNNFTKEELPDYVKIITLPEEEEEKTFPRYMMVRDDENDKWQKKKVYFVVNGSYYPYVVSSVHEFCYISFKYAKELPKTVTMKEVCECFGRDVIVEIDED